MKPKMLALLALTFAAQVAAPVLGHTQATHPAFTLVSRITYTDDDGRQKVTEAVRYVSSDGSVRYVTKDESGTISSDYVYERGRGGFFVEREEKKLVKAWQSPPEASDAPLPTAESLRSDPNFLRTEQVLGHTAYVLLSNPLMRDKKDWPSYAPREEIYYAPELGKTPLKEVRYEQGKVVRVSEPMSVTFGEPDAALLKMPEGYEVRPMAPISAGVLNGKAVSLPAPVWPEGARKVKGEVVVQVLVDEEGKVIEAKALEGPDELRQAAVDAALKARFTPTKLSGQPVKVQGTLHYNFVRR